MAIDYVYPVVEVSAVTADAAYVAWATELGLSTTATLQSMNIADSAWASFQLDAASTVAGATNAQFSAQGLIGWSKSPKAGVEIATDYWSVSYNGGQPDMMIGMRLISPNTPWMTSSATKLQKAGGFTILFGRLTLNGYPTNYFEFAIKFSPTLPTQPKLIITSQSDNLQISYVRVDPTVLPARFASANTSKGSWRIAPGYSTIGARVIGGASDYIRRRLFYPLPRLYNISIPDSIDNTLTGPSFRRLPSPPPMVSLGGRFIAATPAKKDMYFGGNGVVEGFVTVDGVVSQRAVTIYDRATKLPVGSQMSQPNGKFRFPGLDKSRKYFVLGDYGSEARESILRDRITFENGVEVQTIPAFIGGSFPVIVIGGAFSFTPFLTKDVGAVAWSISVGVLPQGLVINSSTGTISGATMDTEAFAFTIMAEWLTGFTSQSVSPSIMSDGDLYYDKVSLLLDGNGINNSTAFIDRSPSAWTVTPRGSVKMSITQKKYGSTSMYFDGTSAGLSIPPSTAFDFGTGDFTIECFAWRTNIADKCGHMFCIGNQATFAFKHFGSQLYIYSLASGSLCISTNEFPAETMCHLALVRAGTTFTLYVNGRPVSSSTYAGAIGSSTVDVEIGRSYNGSIYEYFGGYIDDLRVTKGVARYTSAFNAPGVPHSSIWTDQYVDKVVVLLRGNGVNGTAVFTDSSISPKAVTVTGTAVNSSLQSKFGGGSIRPTMGGYLQVGSPSDFVFGTGDFTIEGWFFMVSAPAAFYALAEFRSTSTNGRYPLVYVLPDRKLGYYVDAIEALSSATAIPLNTWTHWAMTRKSGQVKLFVAGTPSATSYPDPGSYPGNRLQIAASGYDPTGAAGRIDGYLDEVRITKGVARYDAAFTPPPCEFPGADKP